MSSELLTIIGIICGKKGYFPAIITVSTPVDETRFVSSCLVGSSPARHDLKSYAKILRSVANSGSGVRVKLPFRQSGSNSVGRVSLRTLDCVGGVDG